MKFVYFENNFYEVVAELKPFDGPAMVHAYPLNQDFSRKHGFPFPVKLPPDECIPVTSPKQEEEEMRRKIQVFIAGLSFQERMILQREICGNCDGEQDE